MHWLQACGILKKIKEPHMNKIPLIPLPQQSQDEPLKPIQLGMIWFIWASGMIIALFAFVIEWQAARVKVKPHKVHEKTKLPGNADIVSTTQGTLIQYRFKPHA